VAATTNKSAGKRKKVLLTGATGYIGKRLLPALIQSGYHVVCCVRDAKRFDPPDSLRNQITVVEADLLQAQSLQAIPRDIHGAYYLVHSMSNSKKFVDMEQDSARNFRDVVAKTDAEHVIYLGGIVNAATLSQHLRSRQNVENILAEGDYNFTALRAGIIIGSGSASFEIIRDLVEKLPVMVAPKWLKTRCQPIAVSDVVSFLSKTLFCAKTYGKHFDIGGRDVLSYKKMLQEFARLRGLRRVILSVPVMTPRLSSYWLYFVTSTSFKLARSLVDSMHVEVVCAQNNLEHILDIQPLGYSDAVKKAFRTIESNEIVSSWKDSMISSDLSVRISDFIRVPRYGCFTDTRKKTVDSVQECLDKIWSLGGDIGWYHGDWLWRLRGFIDKLWGGVGLRRGRTNPHEIHVGDTLDFWRVLYADRSEGRLLLLAEMKLPGEAWLEFKLQGNVLVQTATFRPLGIAGRLYWYAVTPLHGYIFQGLITKLATSHQQNT